MCDSDSDDDKPQLSAATFAALQQFYSEQEEQERKFEEAKTGIIDDVELQENWQLSQFWYDDNTAIRLAEEAVRIAGENGRIACISAPTAYKKLREIKPEGCVAKCLEFDERFKIYGEDFEFYDYNNPLKLPAEWKESFDIVIADPPFLNEDCLCKTAVTVKYLAKDKIIVCTGAIMEDLVHKLLSANPCVFQPKHSSGLQNEFRCYINYESENMNKP